MRCLLFNRQHFCQPENRPQSGFTLIELLLIIVLLGVLAVAAINAFEGNEDQGRLNITRLEMAELQKALLQFRRDNRELPCRVYRAGEYNPFDFENAYGNQFSDSYVFRLIRIERTGKRGVKTQLIQGGQEKPVMPY